MDSIIKLLEKIYLTVKNTRSFNSKRLPTTVIGGENSREDIGIKTNSLENSYVEVNGDNTCIFYYGTEEKSLPVVHAALYIEEFLRKKIKEQLIEQEINKPEVETIDKQEYIMALNNSELEILKTAVGHKQIMPRFKPINRFLPVKPFKRKRPFEPKNPWKSL